MVEMVCRLSPWNVPKDALIDGLQTAHIGLWRLDRLSLRIDWSDEALRILGLTAEEQIAFSADVAISDLVHPEDAARLQIWLMRTVNTPFQMDCRLRVSAGRPRVVRFFVLAQTSLEENIIFGTLTDVTEAEHRRREAESFRVVSEDSLTLIASILPDGLVEEISPSVAALLGYQPEDLVHCPFCQLAHPDDRQLVEAHLCADCPQRRVALRLRHKAGRHIWFEASFVKIFSADGQLHRVVAIARDISEQRHAEERLRLAQHIARVGHWSWQQGAPAAECSDEMLSIWGLPHSVRTMNLKTFLRTVQSEDRLRVLSSMREARMGRNYDMEYRILRSDGVIRHIHGLGIEAPLDEFGRPLHLLGTVQDITERKQVEMALRESMTNLDKAQHVAKLGNFVRDWGNGTVYWSRELYRIWDLEPGSNISLDHLLPRVHPDDQHALLERFSRARELGEGYTYEFRIMARDGGQRLLLVQCEVNREDGVVRKSLGVVRDITDEKQAAQTLRESEEILLQSEKLSVVGQLAAGIAHEIRNPLTSLKGFTQLLRAKHPGENDRYFEVMLTELSRIETTLSELLVLAKPHASDKQNALVHTLLEEVVALLTPQANMSNVVIVSRLDKDVPMICAAPNQLKQVFINLVKNAIESMPDGGHLTVSLSRDGERVLIRFEDEGEGIAPECLNRLGEPFYTTKENGTGLGFMVTKRIVENHKGRIRVTSEVGRGTTIEVSLPIAVAS